MQRELTQAVRLVLPRNRDPLVRCTFAASREARWRGEQGSCGAMIPYRPRKPCPECGAIQDRAYAPAPGPDSRIVSRDTVIVDEETERIEVVYAVCAYDLATDLAASLRHVKWDRDVHSKANTTTRLSGIAVTHTTFGYQPPQPIRRRYGCSRSTFNTKYPEAMARLAEFCRVAEYALHTYASDVHDYTARIVGERVPDAWRISGTPWTSGIINRTAALPFHRDQGNIKGSWSAMLAARRGVSGGLLYLADYDTYLEVGHGSISIFDGQSVIHGVTPMKVTHPSGFRYTVVTYAKHEMGKCCADPADEAERAKLEVTKAEDRRLAGYRPSRRGRKQ